MRLAAVRQMCVEKMGFVLLTLAIVVVLLYLRAPLDSREAFSIGYQPVARLSLC